MPACDSGLLLDANDASEKAMNLRSSVLMGWILMCTSLCFLALWSTLLAVINVDTVVELICDCKWLKALSLFSPAADEAPTAAAAAAAGG